MISTFRCYVTDQRLTILDYDETKTSARYRAVINEDKIAVLHLQTVDTEDTPDVSQLSLCQGILEPKSRRFCHLPLQQIFWFSFSSRRLRRTSSTGKMTSIKYSDRIIFYKIVGAETACW